MQKEKYVSINLQCSKILGKIHMGKKYLVTYFLTSGVTTTDLNWMDKRNRSSVEMNDKRSGMERAGESLRQSYPGATLLLGY